MHASFKLRACYEDICLHYVMVLPKIDLITSQIYFDRKSSPEEQKLLDSPSQQHCISYLGTIFCFFFLGVHSLSAVYKMYSCRLKEIYLDKRITSVIKA